MSKNRKLCPFRKVTTRKVDDATGRVIEREQFQICAGKVCMAYVYTAPIIFADCAKNPDNWGALDCWTGERISKTKGNPRRLGF